MAQLKVISATLLAEHNTVQITDNNISNDSIFEVYVDDSNIVCNNIVVGGHTANITFDTKPSENVNVKVMINNIDGEFVISFPGIEYNDLTSGKGLHIGNIVDYSGMQPVNYMVYNGLAEEEIVPTDTIPDSVLYHSTSGNIWKKLDASNLDYDDSSTIYSAMGDIDELETENKNLVGAINEVKNSSSDLDPEVRQLTLVNNVGPYYSSYTGRDFSQYGKVVNYGAHLKCISSINTNTWVTIARLPNDVKPITTLYYPLISANNKKVLGLYAVNVGGEVQVYAYNETLLNQGFIISFSVVIR